MDTLEAEKALRRSDYFVRGLLACLSERCEEAKGLSVELFIDPKTVARNRRSARAMACAGVKRGVGRIGICQNIGQLPDTFLAGVLIHELTHITFGLLGGEDCEVDTDATVLVVAPDAHYRYEDCAYHDWLTGRLRVGRNLQRVSAGFLDKCLHHRMTGKRGIRERVSITWKRKKT